MSRGRIETKWEMEDGKQLKTGKSTQAEWREGMERGQELLYKAGRQDPKGKWKGGSVTLSSSGKVPSTVIYHEGTPWDGQGGHGDGGTLLVPDLRDPGVPER